METVNIDTLLEVRGVACEGGDSVLIREKDSGWMEPEPSVRSAWYLGGYHTLYSVCDVQMHHATKLELLT